jgi:hypothetical protein
LSSLLLLLVISTIAYYPMSGRHFVPCFWFQVFAHLPASGAAFMREREGRVVSIGIMRSRSVVFGTRVKIRHWNGRLHLGISKRKNVSMIKSCRGRGTVIWLDVTTTTTTTNDIMIDGGGSILSITINYMPISFLAGKCPILKNKNLPRKETMYVCTKNPNAVKKCSVCDRMHASFLPFVPDGKTWWLWFVAVVVVLL